MEEEKEEGKALDNSINKERKEWVRKRRRRKWRRKLREPMQDQKQEKV